MDDASAARAHAPLPPPASGTASDGVRLAYRELGTGRPLILLHGFLSSGTANWLLPGHAQCLAACGRRVVVPDLRAHGRSGKPTDAASYPRDVLVDDVLGLAAQLGITGFDVAGYSLGARLALRLMLRGAPIARAVLAGQGYDSITRRTGRYREADWFVRSLGRRPENDRTALQHLLGTSVPFTSEELSSIDVPTLVVKGRDDHPDDGRALADALRGAFVEVPGDHLSAAGSPEFGAVMVDFLCEDGRTNS